ncbi:EAL domain-containing protein [Microvirga tunisiensis]|uniref:EAL domain-containing protein n=1 Tax=Pannonibacter tanglangensis TaxID=2750084 RepID=A0A7X5F1I3_9HYPH|nr:EAL domain-containing protein [Pannonibacter sp. XCT-53]NBN78037.1 EAL domain-containing protein [Pannonibacter sp. XCT-53]
MAPLEKALLADLSQPAVQKVMLESLQSESAWLRAILDQISDYVFVKDLRSRFLFANRAVADDLGFASADELIGQTDFLLHPRQVALGFFRDEQRVMRTGEPLIGREEFIQLPDGQQRWFSTSKYPLRDETGRLIGLLGISRDITDRKRSDRLRDGQAQVLEMISSSAPLSRVLDCLVRLIEDQFDGLLGSILLLDEDGVHMRHGSAPSLPDAYSARIDGMAIGPKVGSCGTAAFRREPVIVTDIMSDPLWEEFRALAEVGGVRACWSTPILSLAGQVLGTFAIYARRPLAPRPAELRLINDTARIAAIAIERKRAEDRIRFLAHHDPLTGLPNRSLLPPCLDQARQLESGRGGRVAVVFLDLDHFKAVNDSFGHAAGDQLLVIVAERMKACLSASDAVLRLGGDEFVLLIPVGADHPEGLRAQLARLRTAIAEPVELAGRTFHVTCSMGVAICPDHGTEADALLVQADAAMYRAKEAGRNTFEFYRPDAGEEAGNNLLLLEEIRSGLTRGEFLLHYQPQIDLASGRLCGLEALVRWAHPQRGLLGPDQFIPVAEEGGLIHALGKFVLKTACRQLQAWQRQGVPVVPVSVNVSARQFAHPGWTDLVRVQIERSGIDPHQLELELTESMLMRNVEQAIATMHELRALGVTFAIDDFGTGYSSLSVLRSFPVSRLKIDQAFVRDITRDTSGRGIAEAIISLGHTLKLRVIAEGVETPEQLEFLKAAGCDEAQGYLFARPMPADEIPGQLARDPGQTGAEP